MRLIAVAIGRTRRLEIQGETVTTAYLKEAHDGPCYIGLTGPEGNETAVHPDTVYAIAAEHYDYWAGRLGQDAASWPPGYFAENLTISGLSEAELHPGDQLRIGDAVRLIVTGPRIPCFKVAWRMQQPQSFVREFAVSGHTGIYFAVLEPGSVQAGDDVEIIHRELGNPTVQELGAIVRGELPVTQAGLERLLGLPYLSKTCALLLRGAYYRMLDQPDREHLWEGWRTFVVSDVTDETADIRSFDLRASDGRALPRLLAGQFVAVRFKDESGREYVRPWSLSKYTLHASSWRITVRREGSAGGSAALHRHMTRGSLLELRPPMGQFRLDRTGVMPLVLVGAGIGITPLLAMAHAHLERGPHAPPARLIHCVRNGQSHAMRAEVAALERDYANFSSRVFYSQPSEADRHSRQAYQDGRLTADRLIAALQDLEIQFAGKVIPVPWYETDLYLCGPASFLLDLKSALLARGARAERIRMEHFATGARSFDGALEPAGSKARPIQARVLFRRSGQEALWTGAADVTILQLATTIGLQLPFSCASGYCQTCQCRIITGQATYDTTPLSIPAPGHVLLCCAKPASELLVLDA